MMRARTRLTALAAGLTLALGAPAATAATADQAQPAASASVEHGPAPTKESIGVDGPYKVASKKAPIDLKRSFYGGTIYYPADAGKGETYGTVVTMPGFLEPGAVMDLVAKRLASHGFVVMRAEALTPFSIPLVRAQAVLSAQKVLHADADLAPIMDTERTALVGHSMGGGGVLHAAAMSEQDAVIPIHPWAQTIFPLVKEPTLTIGGLLDNVAPMVEYTLPIYASIGSETKGLFTDLAGTHWAGLVDNKVIQGRILSFVKLHVDGDTRYEQFVCAPAEKGFTYKSPC
ncbi:hypothetical protein CYJ76_05855 [Kytococcus schroeteri]|uniref:PET hydrolase/cutinase-like domain-containing protein n=2 Tax=Kytococcus schroeteri TaxID=138300 RepID=A0A2I1PAZ1_9MICO|nr:hypothetical protein CYJ76_05855 [Kytococcus schroeteri]